MTIYWHYTNAIGLERIIDSRHIKPSTLHVPEHEIPAVWLTRSDKWDRTSNEIAIQKKTGERITVRTTDAQAIMAGGLYRFGIPENRVIPYPRCNKMLGIGQRRVKILNENARAVGIKPSDWGTSKEPIQLSDPDLIFAHRLNQAWHIAAVIDAPTILETNFDLYEPLMREAFEGNMPDWAYKDI